MVRKTEGHKTSSQMRLSFPLSAQGTDHRAQPQDVLKDKVNTFCLTIFRNRDTRYTETPPHQDRVQNSNAYFNMEA